MYEWAHTGHNTMLQLIEYRVSIKYWRHNQPKHVIERMHELDQYVLCTPGWDQDAIDKPDPLLLVPLQRGTMR